MASRSWLRGAEVEHERMARESEERRSLEFPDERAEEADYSRRNRSNGGFIYILVGIALIALLIGLIWFFF